MDGKIWPNIEFNPPPDLLQLGTGEYMETADCMRVLTYKDFYCNFSIMTKNLFLILANVRVSGSFSLEDPLKP